jgi:nucleoside recognition membrane protein YjiH
MVQNSIGKAAKTIQSLLRTVLPQVLVLILLLSVAAFAISGTSQKPIHHHLPIAHHHFHASSHPHLTQHIAQARPSQ